MEKGCSGEEFADPIRTPVDCSGEATFAMLAGPTIDFLPILPNALLRFDKTDL